MQSECRYGTLPTNCFESSTGLANRLRICIKSIPDQRKCVVRLYDTLNLGRLRKRLVNLHLLTAILCGQTGVHFRSLHAHTLLHRAPMLPGWTKSVGSDHNLLH